MSFSMSQINRKSVTKKTNICECLRLLRNDILLTENVRYSLWQYAQYRFNKRNHSTFSANNLNGMIQDLFEHLFNKPYNQVTYTDVYNNENLIINEIGRAIYYGATKHLYYDENDIICVDNLTLRKNIKDEPIRLPEDKKLEMNELENYFKGLII